MSEQLKSGLIKTLYIVEDYLPDIVLGGGWVPLIYAHYVVRNRDIFPILTSDVDFMVNNTVPTRGDKDIDTILQNAGLEPKYYGTANQPIVHYAGNIDGNEITIEFLTDLKGSGEKTIIEVQKGLNAEALRYINISTENRLNVRIDDSNKYGFKNSIDINVPSPGAFVFHKGIVFPLRTDRLKREKDLYYIFNTLQMDSNLYETIIRELNDLSNQYKVWYKKFKRNISDNFNDISSDGVLSILNQRPGNHYTSYNVDQFKNFVYYKFQEFMEKIA